MDGRQDRDGARPLSLAGDRLDHRRAYKPLDVGNGIVSGTLTPGGRWLSLGIAHPRHGRVVLSDAPRFDEALRRDPVAVRAYRAALASPTREGFGLEPPASGAADALLVAGSLPLSVHDAPEARWEILTFAPDGRRGAVQLVRVLAKRDVSVAPRWTGQPRLARAAYTELTEGGPLPPVDERPVRGRDGALWWIEDADLGAAVAITLDPPFELPAGASRSFALAVAFGHDRRDASGEARSLAAAAVDLAERTRRTRSVPSATALSRTGRRAVAYALDCAVSRIDEERSAVLADHELLPLVWTRDAYYVCRMLLAIEPDGRGGAAAARFLRWCFEIAERRDGWWPRASLASGQAKDPAFQLDQQLYPLLLLADHARLTRDEGLVRRYGGERDRVLRAILDRRSSFGLVATEETPADDPLDLPFHFSSHVLLWRVLGDHDEVASGALRDATTTHFAADDLFAYAIHGPRAEGALRYHDANDLPTVFAPGWAFCAASDERWLATIAFAWSPRNRAFVPGRYGGLGSVHTLHPWPLGDLQELVVARVLGDRARAARATDRLRAVRTWDGMLPEAYDEATAVVASRHWFAWPIALWALLEHEPRLTAP